ncbi:MAG: hypothetical protein JWM93_2286 [Frankiales bacterium]|nr:hypothetical protein [Frankiales bacterium]
MTLLEIRDLNIAVRTATGLRPVVHGVGLTVDAGRIVGLVGESGSGKSLTVMSVPRLTPQTVVTGRILLGGRDMVTASPRELRRLRGARVGVVFQDPLSTLHPLHRIGWQVVEAVRAHTRAPRRAATARATELLAQVGIADPTRALSSYPHELSGGMRQRVGIAMAIAGEPDLLIADEPTTALDVTVQAQILELFDRLRTTTGMAVLLVSHDLAVVSGIADDVVVMHQGRVVDSGPTSAVFAAPSSEHTRRLLTAATPGGAR